MEKIHPYIDLYVESSTHAYTTAIIFSIQYVSAFQHLPISPFVFPCHSYALMYCLIENLYHSYTFGLWKMYKSLVELYMCDECETFEWVYCGFCSTSVNTRTQTDISIYRRNWYINENSYHMNSFITHATPVVNMLRNFMLISQCTQLEV